MCVCCNCCYTHIYIYVSLPFKSPPIFMFDNEEYLIKMYTDTNFLCEELHSSFVRYGSYSVNDPLFLSRYVLVLVNAMRF